MNYELEIAFDFKNSKEYFVRYEPIELTDSEKWKNLSKNLKKLIFMLSNIIGEIKLKNLTKFIKNFKILIFLYTNRRRKTQKS